MQGNQQGHGQGCEKSHKSCGETQKTIFQGNKNEERSFCKRRQNDLSGKNKKRSYNGENKNKPEWAEPGKNTNGSEFSRTIRKHRLKLEKKTTNRRNEEKSYQERGKQDKHPQAFSKRERANGARAKKKRHAGGHDARRAIGHSV